VTSPNVENTMDDSLQHTWLCPSCGRRVPAQVDTCRCGLARTAALREEIDAGKDPAAAAQKPAALLPWLARIVLGYRTDVELPRRWRPLLRGSLIAAVALVFVITVMLLDGEPPRTRENIRVLSRLDDYTRNSEPSAANTIPAFLALPGSVGVLAIALAPDLVSSGNASTSAQDIKSISETEMQKGFCTRSVHLLVRQQYPGVYDGLSDAELERRVIDRHPEYRDKLCILPAWIDATPHEIVKYELKPRVAVMPQPSVWPWAALITGVFAIAALNVYYRLLVSQFTSAS
jgi:hypothetical protein